jgi:hypothetical protein
MGELLSLTPISVTRSIIDTTHMGSSNESRTKLGGLIDAGQVSAQVQFDPATADTNNHVKALNAVYGAGAPVAFIAQLGTVATWTGTAVVSGFSVGELTADNKQVATITLDVSGKPTLAGVGGGGGGGSA